MREVRFKNIGGNAVPLQPWPQKFYVSRELFERDAFEIRPLTFAGLLKGVATNFVAMSYWRFCRLLWRAGFLRPPEGERFSFRRHWCWRFWVQR